MKSESAAKSKNKKSKKGKGSTFPSLPPPPPPPLPPSSSTITLLEQQKQATSPIETMSTISSSSTAAAANNISLESSNNTTTPKPMRHKRAGSGVTASIKENRHNDRFHQLFPSVPIYERVLDTYSCAYIKSLNLYQGLLYLTSNYACFYSKILSHETILVLRWFDIQAVRKTMHLIFPTAISIDTNNSTYSFTSFLSRSTAYEHLVSLWTRSKHKQYEDLETYIFRHRLLENKATTLEEQQTTSDVESKANGSSSSTNDNNNKKIDAPCHIGLPLENDSSIVDLNDNKNNNDSNKIKETSETTTTETVNTTNSAQQQQIKQSAQITISSSKHSNGNDSLSTLQSPLFSYNKNSLKQNNIFYDLNFSDKNRVTASLRPNKPLLQKVRVLFGTFIPGFSECVLLLLNAFLLLGKVNQVDNLFNEILLRQQNQQPNELHEPQSSSIFYY